MMMALPAFIQVPGGRLHSLSWFLPLLLSLLMAYPLPASAESCTVQRMASELPVSGCNRAFSLHVLEMHLQDTLDGEQAAPGQQWLVLDLRFDNWLSADLMFRLEQQEALLVGSLTRQLFLLVDNRQVLRPRLPAQAPSQDSFVLGEVGAQQRVRVAYAIPENCSALSLSYHHEGYADILIPLRGELLSSSLQQEAASQQASNDVMALGMHGASFHEQWRGEPAPEDLHWLVVDLRGQSEWLSEVDALALDAAAELGEMRPLRRVMEYVGAENMLQVLVDDNYAYLREQRLGSLEATPAWLSHAWAGGEAVFALPRSAQKVELVAYFGQFIAPGIASTEREPLRFSILEGQAMEEQRMSPLAELADEPTPVIVHAATRLSHFAGHQAADDEYLLMLDASMANTSTENGMMSVSNRFHLQPETTPAQAQPHAAPQSISPLGVYLPGPKAFAEPFLLPAGEQRRFQLLYRVPRDTETLTLVYAGVSMTAEQTLTADNVLNAP